MADEIHRLTFPMEDGSPRTVNFDEPLDYFRLVEMQDQAQSFTNDNHVETANFASYLILEMGWRFLTEIEFFLHAALQAIHTQIKRGLIWSFAYDNMKMIDGSLTAAFNPGETVVSCDVTPALNELYWIMNKRGKYQVFLCLTNDPIVIFQPASVLKFEAGDPIRSWKYCPQLVTVGEGVNESWDETKLYYSYDVRARIVEDTE